MPTEEHFAKYPPFPSDVPVVQLECLSFTKLLAGDEAESERLFEACQHTGFFLLNLRGTAEGETMLKHAAKAFKLTEQIHELDQDELKKYAYRPPADLFGYCLSPQCSSSQFSRSLFFQPAAICPSPHPPPKRIQD